MAVAVLLAAGAAFLSALAVVFQRVALESAPDTGSLNPRLLVHALQKRGWLAGFALMLGTFALQASALHFGQLSLVQPVLTMELVFLVAILAIGFHRSVGRREIFGILAIVAGLAAFFASAAPAVGTGQPGTTAWVAMSAAVIACALVLIAAGRIGPRWWRAAVLGAGAATLFAYNAALAKTMTWLLGHGGVVHLFETPDPYLIALSGACGLFVLQGSLHSGPVTASRTANVVVNPLVSIVIGLTAFGEHIRGGALFIVLDILSIAILCLGIAILARSPLITSLSEEYLATAPAPATVPVPQPE
ncbi:MAG TPA: DMT family transporter [Streptosporangiaceae bacterium]|nr:DMT family transporter [Streptosporangiaceae bacterium]